MKRFGLISHIRRPDIEKTTRLITDWLKDHDLEYYVSEELKSYVTDKSRLRPYREIWKDIDCAISLGGDGTMLSSIREVGHHDIPVFGINVGRLGFLTEILAQDIPRALERIRTDNYTIEKRMVLQTEITGTEMKDQYALNDVVLDHGDSLRLIRLDLYCNGQFVSSYNSDGLIISTPTGSTAYNLAAGGPVIHPQLGAIIACPICPHSLTLRPIIFTDTSEILIKVASTRSEVRMTLDGQVNCMLDEDAEVKIIKAPHLIKLIRIKEFSFFEVLRTKLHWGAQPLSSPDA